MARQKIPGIKKSRLQQLSDAQASKRKKLDLNTTESTPEPQSRLSNTDSETESGNKNDKNDKSNLGWYWHNSSDDESSDPSEEEDEGEWDSSDDSEKNTIASLPPPSPVPTKVLHWNKTGEAQLRGAWGKKSSATNERRKRDAKERQRQASESYSIKAMFTKILERQQAARLQQTGMKKVLNGEKDTSDTPLLPACPPSLSFQEKQAKIRTEALVDMEDLLDLVKVQEQKYRYRLLPQTNFYQRHEMVKKFLAIQKRNILMQTRRQLTTSVAASFDQGEPTGRKIVQWENAWVAIREIPS